MVLVVMVVVLGIMVVVVTSPGRIPVVSDSVHP